MDRSIRVRRQTLQAQTAGLLAVSCIAWLDLSRQFTECCSKPHCLAPVRCGGKSDPDFVIAACGIQWVRRELIRSALNVGITPTNDVERYIPEIAGRGPDDDGTFRSRSVANRLWPCLSRRGAEGDGGCEKQNHLPLHRSNETQDQLPRARCAVDAGGRVDGKHSPRGQQACSRSAASPG